MKTIITNLMKKKLYLWSLTDELEGIVEHLDDCTGLQQFMNDKAEYDLDVAQIEEELIQEADKSE